ncbi:trimethylamine N-oxide reductase system protein TorE [Colwellia ponticola]|uniref:Trimethylamine N-oxide reductase system protein TorE n=1 Tax=Colwellia ponticola TaxID=2304625 RepID=A0A8H2JM74_9GAMM|nr:trimethylamine N-oxide reductase system protein TorE [Colwellia ponticola]TMM46437.1 trimethylamine N-oxide reductase system protein TorE [Colwellia ponticola]
MTTKQLHKTTESQSKLKEFKALGFIIVVLFPALCVAAIGGYGLIIWLIQAMGGIVPH